MLFFGKAWGFRIARTLSEVVRKPKCFPRASAVENAPLIAESRGVLYPSDVRAEFVLQAGKAQNLRVAASHLDGVIVPKGEVFSFWAHVPRPTRRRGFVTGRELREGCIIPSIGGGLCQLSNALYDATLTAGFEIIERHAHSREIPGSMAEVGRDATIFWNYVDLRFRPNEDCQLRVELSARELIVQLRAARGQSAQPRFFSPAPAMNFAQAALQTAVAESCETCGVTSCFRHLEQSESANLGFTAWLVDAWGPEFDRYLREEHMPDDWLFLPLAGVRFRVNSYAWRSAADFQNVRQAPLETLHRSLVSRRLAAQGAKRQQALLHFDARLARRFAKMIPPAATHLVVSQNLLPFLWRDGVLGGRTFDVLMTRLPISELQRVLDRAHALHAESRTLADFRADPALVENETAALSEARRWITPHSAIAKLAGSRARKLAWKIPSASRVAGGENIVFPASTLGRKGAYELREAARLLGLHIVLAGHVIESADFWQGIETAPAGENWLANAKAVVLPAWIEPQPRRLLRAVAAGIPVIASEACGMSDVAGVTTLPEGDVGALVAALSKVIGECTDKLVPKFLKPVPLTR